MKTVKFWKVFRKFPWTLFKFSLQILLDTTHIFPTTKINKTDSWGPKIWIKFYYPLGSFHPFIFVRWINCFLYGIQSVDLSSRDSNLLLLFVAIFLKSYNIFQKSRLLIWPQWTQMLGIYMKIRKVKTLAYLIGELLFGDIFS